MRMPTEQYGLRVTLLAFGLAVVALPFGLLLVEVVREGPLVDVDTWAAEQLHEAFRDAPVAVDVIEAISALGKPVVLYVLCVLVAVWLASRRHAPLAIYAVTTIVLGGLINNGAKEAVDRARPLFEEPIATSSGKSFPSGHAMMSIVGYGTLLLIFLPVVPRRRHPLVIGATALLVLAIGFTRLALGVHYFTDVLGGFVLGAAWLALSTAAFEIWREDRGLRPTHPLEEGVEPRL